MVWKAKKNFYNILHVRNITDRKQIWKLWQSSEDKVVAGECEVAETFM